MARKRTGNPPGRRPFSEKGVRVRRTVSLAPDVDALIEPALKPGQDVSGYISDLIKADAKRRKRRS